MARSLYVHIPFCAGKCLYCSFPVSAGFIRKEEEYLAALEREAGHRTLQECGPVYVGGGTPSLLSRQGVERLGRLIADNFSVDKQAEFTFEANPESVDIARALAWRAAGANRVSLGVQSFDDSRLRWLGRGHTAAGAAEAFGILRQAGFKNINVDLIFGFPGQSVDELARDVDRILALGSEHVSLYMLEIEPRSLFYARALKVDPDDQAEAYELVRARIESAGARQYEVSNFSFPGFESRYNLNTWRAGEYWGLGMSAHSHIDGRRFWNADTLPGYLSMMAASGSAETGSEQLSSQGKLMEAFLFGLRLNEGVDILLLEQRFGVRISDDRRAILGSFVRDGLLTDEDGRIKATSRGRMVLDEISARLV
jgi:oxygen-independent coproporphyrinogen-3 oxidase